jgi:hypothetical protein
VRERGHGLKGIAHELRGSAVNVGALPLADLAGQMEGFAARDDWDAIVLLAAHIEREIVRTSEFVSRRTANRIA